MTFVSVLPANSTDFERSIEEANRIPADMHDGVDEIRGLKYARPLNVTVAPSLIVEYGLGPISKFFGTAEDLIDIGRAWQKIRGTAQAVVSALGWIGYDAITIDDKNPYRRRWHLYQIAMGELPGDDETARLMDAEYLAGISDPARSFFWRGHHGYDVPGLEFGEHRWGEAIIGDSSGVRIGGKTKWSHGKETSGSITATNAERIAAGVNFSAGQAITWESGLTWNAPGLTWNGISNAAKVKAWVLAQKVTYVAFYDSADAVIGYARVVRTPVDVTAPGNTTTATIRYVVRTGFGDGFGKTAVKASLIFGCEATGVPVARQWLAPANAAFPSGMTKVGEVALNIKFQKTVRQFVTIDLTI